MYIITTNNFNSIQFGRMDFFETVTHSNVDKLLDSFHLAAENHNLEDYFGCFHRNGTFLGSDATEHWTVDKFLEFSRPYFISGKGWTYRPIPGSRKFHMLEGGNENENTMIICTFDELVKSKSYGITFRGSGALVKDQKKNAWFILSYHLSIPIPNEWAGSSSFCTSLNSFEVVSKEAAAEKAAAELLAEIDREEEESRDKTSSSSNSKNKKKKGKGK